MCYELHWYFGVPVLGFVEVRSEYSFQLLIPCPVALDHVVEQHRVPQQSIDLLGYLGTFVAAHGLVRPEVVAEVPVEGHPVAGPLHLLFEAIQDRQDMVANELVH